jgi:hypothetical protein
VAAVSGTRLVVIDSAASLDGGRWLRFRKGPGQLQWQWQGRGRLRGKGAFGSFRRLAGKGALAVAMSSVAFGHVGVVDRAVVPKMGVPLGQDAVGVVTVDVGSQAPSAPMSHPQAVETKPLRHCICAHHVMWTTPSDDNCRWAVDGT